MEGVHPLSTFVETVMRMPFATFINTRSRCTNYNDYGGGKNGGNCEAEGETGREEGRGARKRVVRFDGLRECDYLKS